MKRLTPIATVGCCLALVATPAAALAHNSHHHRGSENKQNGTIQSFSTDTDVLTIKLADNSMMSGVVTQRTQLKCVSSQLNASSTRLRARVADHGGRGGGDNGSGSGDVQESADNGQATQPGANDQNEATEPNDQNEATETNDQNDQNEAPEQPGTSTVSSNSAGSAGVLASRASCGMSSLVPGAKVTRARLRMRHGSESFDQIRLAV